MAASRSDTHSPVPERCAGSCVHVHRHLLPSVNSATFLKHLLCNVKKCLCPQSCVKQTKNPPLQKHYKNNNSK